MIANYLTGGIMDGVPESYAMADGRFVNHPTLAIMAPDGWRLVSSKAEPESGWRVTKWNVLLNDGGETVRLEIEEQENIAAVELAANGERWALDNRYIGYCDQLRVALGGQQTKTKLGFEELEPMMLTLKAASLQSYNDLRDAMQVANSALIRFDVRWWDNCVWHPEVEI
jgi:hypothetical protein